MTTYRVPPTFAAMKKQASFLALLPLVAACSGSPVAPTLTDDTPSGTATSTAKNKPKLLSESDTLRVYELWRWCPDNVEMPNDARQLRAGCVATIQCEANWTGDEIRMEITSQDYGMRLYLDNLGDGIAKLYVSRLSHTGTAIVTCSARSLTAWDGWTVVQ